MAIAARLSRKLHEVFGQEAAEAMVAWMQRVDASRSELRELNDLSFARCDARVTMQSSLVRGLTAGLSLSVLLGSSLCGQDITQRDGPPRADTPRILVATFHSSDPQLGIQAAAEIRRALANKYSAKELFVIAASAINGMFHGRSPFDSALGVADLAELAKQVRAEEMVDGTVSRTAAGIRLDTRLFIPFAAEMDAQPLPGVAASDIHDAARELVSELSTARKALPPYHACLNAARAGKYSDAMGEARLGVARYPDSPFDRICMLRVLVAAKASPDSIIAVVRAIVSIDSSSIAALSCLENAYAQKGDAANASEAERRLNRLDPSHGRLRNQFDGPMDPSRALPIIDSLLVNNPGDPSLLRTKWLLELRAKRYKQAIATGEELAKLDTAMVTRDSFQRMIGAAQSDSDAAAVQQLAARAAQKFPKDPGFSLLLAQGYRRSGQLQQALQAAERAIQNDPKNTMAWLFAITVADEMNQPDTLLALAKQGSRRRCEQGHPEPVDPWPRGRRDQEGTRLRVTRRLDGRAQPRAGNGSNHPVTTEQEFGRRCGSSDCRFDHRRRSDSRKESQEG